MLVNRTEYSMFLIYDVSMELGCQSEIHDGMAYTSATKIVKKHTWKLILANIPFRYVDL